MFCIPVLIFGGSEGVVSHFHVLLSQTRFRWIVGRRVPFSCFALPNSFSAVLRASGPVFMFCVPVLIFGGCEGVGSHFHVLCSRHVFGSMERQDPFSCFALPDTFLAVRRVSGPVFMFCAPGLIFVVSEGVGSRFHVLRPYTRFRRYSGPVIMFCATRLVFGDTEGVGSHFLVCALELIFYGTDGICYRLYVLRSQTHFRRCGGRHVPFSCFALPRLLSRRW
jgi:hypothetical protein